MSTSIAPPPFERLASGTTLQEARDPREWGPLRKHWMTCSARRTSAALGRRCRRPSPYERTAADDGDIVSWGGVDSLRPPTSDFRAIPPPGWPHTLSVRVGAENKRPSRQRRWPRLREVVPTDRPRRGRLARAHRGAGGSLGFHGLWRHTHTCPHLVGVVDPGPLCSRPCPRSRGPPSAWRRATVVVGRRYRHRSRRGGRAPHLPGQLRMQYLHGRLTAEQAPQAHARINSRPSPADHRCSTTRSPMHLARTNARLILAAPRNTV